MNTIQGATNYYPPLTVDNLEAVKRLTRDQVLAMRTLGAEEVRFVVSTYYSLQKFRIASSNRSRALDKAGEPHAVVDWLRNQQETLENQVKRALERWTIEQPIGQWLSAVHGIGPVITAGLIAHVHAETPTASHLWAYAGYDPTRKWEPKKKRPWNAELKTLCWKAGQSFVKTSGSDESFYGKVYLKRKRYEWERNLAGAYADTAKQRTNWNGLDQRLWYAGCYSAETAREFIMHDWETESGRKKFLENNMLKPGEGVHMLPPGHIQARAERYAVKLFLSHFHEVYHWLTHGIRPTLPYAITRLGHADYIAPPHTEVVYNGSWLQLPTIVPPSVE